MAISSFKSPMMSVFVLAYNHECFIKQSIDGILMQKTDFDFEIVVGEDFSSDRTREILTDYSEKFPGRFNLLLHSRNLGSSANQAIVLEACKGEYVAICEGDDYWIDKNKLQKQKDFLDENPDFSMCFTDRRIIDSCGNIIYKTTIPENKKRQLNASEIIGGFIPPTQTVVFRKTLLSNEKSFFDKYKTVYNGDVFLFSFLSTKGKVGYVDIVSAVYRINENGVYGKLDFKDRLCNRFDTLITLDKIIPEEYHKLVMKSLKIILQRLFVLNLQSNHFIKAFGYLFSLANFDIKTCDISSLRAIKLLFKSFFNKQLIITD